MYIRKCLCKDIDHIITFTQKNLVCTFRNLQANKTHNSHMDVGTTAEYLEIWGLRFPLLHPT